MDLFFDFVSYTGPLVNYSRIAPIKSIKEKFKDISNEVLFHFILDQI